MHESIKESMRAGLRKRKGPEEIMKVAEAHEAIADAIEQGNAAQAEGRMKKHFDETFRVFGRLDED
jgi:DNA-binding FadR family transcriptional regulator